jgi:pimeloyl-ACP methyl ester carboxylesterase
MASTTSPAPVTGFASETAVVDGVCLHYRLGGDPDGPPVLLWHGFLGTSYAWRKVMPALAGAGLAVLVPDMRGYGDSDKPAGTEGYDARALAEEFRALVRKIGFGAGKPLTLAAHDMGAPPALLWAADHPDDVAGLLYLEEPVLLAEVLSKVISYTPQTAQTGSLWWWLLALAPGAPEKLIVGNERAFLTWFYDRDPLTSQAIEPAAVEEYLRTFCGHEGVLGALGVYRAAFTTMEQTAPLTGHRISTPTVALGGAKAQGDHVRAMVEMVAHSVDGGTVAGVGHFLPEESPDEIVRQILSMTHPTREDRSLS